MHEGNFLLYNGDGAENIFQEIFSNEFISIDVWVCVCVYYEMVHSYPFLYPAVDSSSESNEEEEEEE